MKFKINWGVGIVIAFVAFIGFILVLIVRMSTEKEFSHDLVVEEYYKKEIGFQDEINAQENANAMKQHIRVQEGDTGIEIIFPSELNTENISGNVNMYRPSNKKLDFDTALQLEDNKMLIPKNKILEGKWKISVQWELDGKNYLYKEKITF